MKGNSLENLKEKDTVEKTEKGKCSNIDGSQVNSSGILIEPAWIGKTNENGNCTDSKESEINNSENMIETNDLGKTYKNGKIFRK